MIDPANVGLISLRFADRRSPNAHAAPAGAVAQTIAGLERLVHLIAMRRDGHTPGKRIRPPLRLQRRYRLIVRAPEAGSFLLPIDLAGADLLAPADVEAVTAELSAVLAAIEAGDDAAFLAATPDPTWRRFILDALGRVAPDPVYGVDLELIMGERRICAATRLDPFVDRLLRGPEDVERSAIVGKLVEMDFVGKSIKLRLRRTQEAVRCSYFDAAELSLLEHPREDVVVFGLVTRSADGRIVQISEIDHIETLDLSPMPIDRIPRGAGAIAARRPFVCEVDFDEQQVLYLARIDDIDLVTFAETRDRLEAAVRDELVVLWDEYAQAQDTDLTAGALALKSKMLAAFAPEEHAA